MNSQGSEHPRLDIENTFADSVGTVPSPSTYMYLAWNNSEEIRMQDTLQHQKSLSLQLQQLNLNQVD